jgi:hypothetical protein
MNLLSEGNLKIFGSLNCRLLGDKSPFSQLNLQRDTMDRGEETARIQCKPFLSVTFYIFKPSESQPFVFYCTSNNCIVGVKNNRIIEYDGLDKDSSVFSHCYSSLFYVGLL